MTIQNKHPVLLMGAVLTITLLVRAAAVQEIKDDIYFFSTEEEFVTQGPEPADGNPVISDGDLLTSRGSVFMRNKELLQVFQVSDDLGLDAVAVIDSERRLVLFSTELDLPDASTNPAATSGDLLGTNGLVIPNAALLAAFGITDNTRYLDLGLDALQLTGKRESILKFIEEAHSISRDEWLSEPKKLPELLLSLEMDIWFSTEGTYRIAGRTGFLDGDLLSAARGRIILSNADALPDPGVPAGIPKRGVDFGMDAAALQKLADDNNLSRTYILFSTEINGRFPTFTDGDIMADRIGMIVPNYDLISPFEPKVKDLGLDALSRIVEDENLILDWEEI